MMQKQQNDFSMKCWVLLGLRNLRETFNSTQSVKHGTYNVSDFCNPSTGAVTSKQGQRIAGHVPGVKYLTTNGIY